MSDRTEAVFGFVRRVVCMVLGVGIIVDGVTTNTNTGWSIVVGMVLVGILPIDHLLAVWFHRRGVELRDDDKDPGGLV